MTSIAPYICCCDTENPPVPVEIQITEICNLCTANRFKGFYGSATYYWDSDNPGLPACMDLEYLMCDPDGIPDSGDEDEYSKLVNPPSCPPIENDCGCGCASEINQSTWCSNSTCRPPSEADISVTTSNLQSQTWTFPYVSTSTENTSGIWAFNDAGNVFLTGHTTSISRFVEVFSGSSPGVLQVRTNPTEECMNCFNTVPDPANPITATIEYRYGGKYLADVPAMVIGGATAAYAGWTCEITSTDCIIRDAGGVIQYTFALASHTMEQLRVALDGTAELVSVRLGPSFSSATFRGVSSTYLPIQGPFAIGNYGAGTWDTINIRHVGDAVEDWQIRLASSSYTYKNSAGVVQGRVFFQHFSGNYGLWEQGFQFQIEQPSFGLCEYVVCEEDGDCYYSGVWSSAPPWGLTNDENCNLKIFWYTDPVTGPVYLPGGTACNYSGIGCGASLVCSITPAWAGGTTSSGWQDSALTDPVSESITEFSGSQSNYSVGVVWCYTGSGPGGPCSFLNDGDAGKCYYQTRTGSQLKQAAKWLKRITAVP